MIKKFFLKINIVQADPLRRSFSETGIFTGSLAVFNKERGEPGYGERVTNRWLFLLIANC